MKIAKLILPFCLLTTNFTVAQTHEAHTHGEAKMWIVLEGNQLSIELETPAANLLGFEHAPRSESENNDVEKVVNTLNIPELLFSISPLCKLNGKNVEVPFSNNGLDESKKELHSEEDEHDAHEHGAVEHEFHDTDDTHKDFRLHYEWLCPSTKSLSIKLNIFNAFTGFEKIRAEWIAFDKQNSWVITKNNAVVELTP